jgi:hypothetical protein
VTSILLLATGRLNPIFFCSFAFFVCRFTQPISDDLEVKAVAPFGQAAILGVVPGAWVTGISPAGLDSTPVEKLTDFNKHKEAFLKQNFFKLYIKTVRVRVAEAISDYTCA